VLGLGPNLFYNSPMEACVVFCRSKKPAARRGKVLLIDAIGEVTRERAASYLKAEHQARIEAAYAAYEDEDGFAKVATREEIAGQGWSLSIPLHVKRLAANVAGAAGELPTLAQAWSAWESSGREFWVEMDGVVDMLGDVITDGTLEAVDG
ncbi:MAG: N-6 DNA methylase, partial [Polyangiaceae bacterium]